MRLCSLGIGADANAGRVTFRDRPHAVEHIREGLSLSPYARRKELTTQDTESQMTR